MEKISVVMPVKNGEKYLDSALAKIALNLIEGDEVIVVDDGSTDRTPQLLSGWCEGDTRFRNFKNSGHGLVDALNHGVEMSSNNWIARFDVDDYYPNDRLEKQRELIKDEVVAIFCDYAFWSQNSSNLGSIQSAVTPTAMVISLFSGRRTPHPGVIFSKGAFFQAGGYRSEDFPAEDLGLWLRMRNFGNLVSVGEILLEYQISQTSITGSRRAESLSMKKSLIEKYALRSEEINDFVTKLPRTIHEYGHLREKARRKIFLLIDTIKYIPAYPLSFAKLKFLKFALFIAVDPGCWKAATSIYWEKKSRGRIR